jgi:multiple sugar transport system permease protein/putative aldouronate transport system permease protein
MTHLSEVSPAVLTDKARHTQQRRQRVREYAGFADRAFAVFIHTFIIGFVVASFIPLLLVVSGSFSSEAALRLNGFKLWPQDFTLSTYQYVFAGRQIITSYSVTLTVTFMGTLLGMIITTPLAYVMASRGTLLSRPLSFMVYFTMIFGGGLIGLYILVANWLGLRNNLWAMILPYLVNPFYAFILVAYFRTIPIEIKEAAIMDGADDWVIFWRMAVPLAKPAIASVSLFYALRYWNDWWLSLLFIDDPRLHSLQVMIRQLHSTINAEQYIQGSGLATGGAVPALGIQLATVVLTIGPIVLLYPFVQRYFVKGMTLGAVKG